jgi:hypothetical protein
LRQRRRMRKRYVSFRRDKGEAGSQHASPMLSSCNGLGVGGRYQCPLWAQRNNHFTWLVTSCGNGVCSMPVMNTCYQLPSLICNARSVTDALSITKGHLCPLPKWVFHVMSEARHCCLGDAAGSSKSCSLQGCHRSTSRSCGWRRGWTKEGYGWWAPQGAKLSFHMPVNDYRMENLTEGQERNESCTQGQMGNEKFSGLRKG